MKDMNNDYIRKVQLLTETECRQAVEAANNGQLSPYWQAYHLNNLEHYKDTILYPENGDILTTQLKSAITQTEQISDALQTAKELACVGSELIFFYEEDNDTVLEISYSVPLHSFCCNIDLESSLTPQNRLSRIKQMRSALENWITVSGTQWKPSVFPVLECIETECFPTMTDVLSYLFGWLDTQTVIISATL